MLGFIGWYRGLESDLNYYREPLEGEKGSHIIDQLEGLNILGQQGGNC